VGAGRSETARAVFGLDRASGRVWIRGHRAARRTPAASIAMGLGFAPEDRKRQGLVMTMSVLDNGTLAILSRIATPLRFVTRGRQRRAVRGYFDRLRVPIPRLDVPVSALSGGNQQKIVLTKWLAARCPVLMLDEPTRGVDVGAKAEIHRLIDDLAASGSAILLISSEMPEILNLSTRIVVFRGGRVVGELARAEAKQDVLMRLMAGVAADSQKDVDPAVPRVAQSETAH
jgi:ribose transport system ATP-binding protein